MHESVDGRQILELLEEFVGSVQQTYGPYGKPVVLHDVNTNRTVTTKDGVSVASFYTTKEPLQAALTNILRQASRSTADSAGDGTTTTVLLAYYIAKHLVNHQNKVDIVECLELLKDSILIESQKFIKNISSKDDLKRIAAISANNDKKVGDIIANAVDAVGTNGAITVHLASRDGIFVEETNGYQIDSGVVSRMMINNKTGILKMDNPLILVTSEEILTLEQVFPALEIAQRAERPLFIIAGDIRDQALAALNLNAQRQNMPIGACLAPEFGEARKEYLQDIAITTGAKFFNSDIGEMISQVEPKDMGKVSKVECGINKTVLFECDGSIEDIEDRIETLKAIAEQIDDPHEGVRIEKRISRLSGGIVKINIGAPTEAEARERKDRVEDAIFAVKSSLSTGYVPGGLFVLMKIADATEKNLGLFHDPVVANIVHQAFSLAIKDMFEILSNSSGCNPYEYRSHIMNNMVANFKEKTTHTLEENKVIEPYKVLRQSVINSFSAVKTLILTERVLINE